MLNKMSPFFAIIASYFVLKEKITPVQGAGVIAAFIGALCIIKPTFANMDLIPSVIGLIGGMGAGIAYTMVRALGKTGIHKSVIVFFFSAFSCLAVLPVLIAGYVPMAPMQLAYLLLAGVAAARRAVLGHQRLLLRPGPGNLGLRLHPGHLLRRPRLYPLRPAAGRAERPRVYPHLRDRGRHLPLQPPPGPLQADSVKGR